MLRIPVLSAIFLLSSMLSCGIAACDENSGSVTVGATLPLSGTFAEWGSMARIGIELAAQDIREGRIENAAPLRVIFEDNRGEPKEAVNGVSKMLDLEGVDAIFSAFTPITQSVKSLVGRAGKVLLYETTLSSIALESPLFFHDYWTIEDGSTMLADIAHKQGRRRIAIAGEEADQCLRFMDGLRKNSGKYAFEIVRDETYLPGTQDFRSLLMRIRGAHPDALFFCPLRNASEFMRQFGDLKIRGMALYAHSLPIASVADTPELRILYEKEGVISSWSSLLPANPNPDQVRFLKAFKGEFRSEILADAGFAYDDIVAFSQAAFRCGKIDRLHNPACHGTEMAKTDLNGILSRLRFDEGRSARREVSAIRVRNGKWENLSIESAVEQRAQTSVPAAALLRIADSLLTHPSGQRL